MLMIALVIILMSVLSPLNAAFDFGKQMIPRGLALTSDVEMRTKQREALEQTITEMKKRYDSEKKLLVDSLDKITAEIELTQRKIAGVSEQKKEFLNKKKSILHDRKQNLLEQEDLWHELLDLLNAHNKLISELLEFFQAQKQSPKAAYSWKELREAQMRIADYALKIENNKNKFDSTKKQRIAATERLASQERQKDVKEKERVSLETKQTMGAIRPNQDGASLKFEGDLLTVELNGIHEKIEFTKLFIEKTDLEARFWEDVIDLDQNKLTDQKKMLHQVESRLILDYNDVELAREEWKKEVGTALKIKEEINKQREPKKIAKEKLAADIEALRLRLADLKTKKSKDKVGYLLIKYQLKALLAQSAALDKSLQFFDAKKDLADVLSSEKELQFNLVELRYKLKIEAADIEAVLIGFKNKQELAASFLKTLKNRNAEVINALIDANRSSDKIKAIQNKLHTKRPLAFKGRESALRAIFASLEKTEDSLDENIDFTQSFLAVNTELISHQEKILNQYQLIINELETRHKVYGIWKRAPQAISLDALVRSTLEAEAFFKKLYWETPTFFKPTRLLKTVRTLTFHDLLLLLSFIIFYIFAFVALRAILGYIKNQCVRIIGQSQGGTRYLYLHIALAFINFALEHVVLLFSWLFIFTHIAMNFSYIFSTLRPFVSNYTIALFHLISIPILVFLASQFIEALTNTNKKLSYFFFAESFQNKFILLITLFCYATATLLPLRSAILAYVETGQSEFATVVMAAYSLILIFVLLFLFSKEDVLKLLPSYPAPLVWLKRKIDKHYYPVFFFCMGLLILANPYIGYSNMAWFLAFAIPSSVFLFYLLFWAHFYIRKYAVFLFMREEDEEIIDKFEHAKAYYGFFVVFSFLILFFGTFVLVSRIWGFDYTPADFWKALSGEWVIRVGYENNKFGFVEFSILSLFIAVGFLVSSFVHRFVLNKLFEILRSEPGTQNTISRIFHYAIIFFALILGLSAINLQQFIFWVGASFGIVLGLSLRDIVADFVAGFFILIERPIEIGNYVQIDNIQGTVHKISARSTTIITSKNHSIIIPNKDLVTKWIINWGHGRFAVGFEIDVRVEHGSDPELVKKTLLAVIQANPLILKVPGVVSRLENFEENALYFLTRAFISARRVKEQWEIAASIRADIVNAFKEQGIALAKPARVLYGPGVSAGQGPKSLDIRFER